MNDLIFQPAIKTLVTVTEMLTKHKQKYTEMIGAASNQGHSRGLEQLS